VSYHRGPGAQNFLGVARSRLALDLGTVGAGEEPAQRSPRDQGQDQASRSHACSAFKRCSRYRKLTSLTVARGPCASSLSGSLLRC